MKHSIALAGLLLTTLAQASDMITHNNNANQTKNKLCFYHAERKKGLTSLCDQIQCDQTGIAAWFMYQGVKTNPNANLADFLYLQGIKKSSSLKTNGRIKEAAKVICTQQPNIQSALVLYFDEKDNGALYAHWWKKDNDDDNGEPLPGFEDTFHRPSESFTSENVTCLLGLRRQLPIFTFPFNKDSLNWAAPESKIAWLDLRTGESLESIAQEILQQDASLEHVIVVGPVRQQQQKQQPAALRAQSKGLLGDCSIS